MKKMLSILVCLSLLLSGLSAAASAEEPVTITMMQELFSDSTPDMTNEWYTYLRENLGVTLDVNFVPT